MAMQTGVASSKVLVLLGAGLTGSIILRNGHLSDVLSEIQELIKGINEVDVSSYHYDPTLLAAQIRQLAQEVRDLTVSRPVTIFNGENTSSGSLASYIMPAAAVGAMGYCYMWWKIGGHHTNSRRAKYCPGRSRRDRTIGRGNREETGEGNSQAKLDE